MDKRRPNPPRLGGDALEVRFRNAVGVIFGLFILYLGYRFYLFVFVTLTGGPPVHRPAGVEGFLPIGALLAFRQWVTTGVYDTIHPAALSIFLAVVVVSILLSRAFCGWLCPIGTLSEALGRLGGFLFGRNLRLPAYLDIPLRSLKYVILGFFLWSIFWVMDVRAVQAFLKDPYYAASDVKMLFFFLNLTPTAARILLVLAILSLLFRGFWCRYLCPYGALLGIVALLSPFKVTRSEGLCTSCRRCDRVCPSFLTPSSRRKVISPECSGCLDCVSECPRQGALEARGPYGISLSPLLWGVSLLAVFFLAIGIAKLTGHWESVLTGEDYRWLFLNSMRFGHPGW